ncbi:DUF4386 domain-containing protein [Paenibacillus sp. sgz500992]|uniref:DUF4386 domain-containing protein n=1 Tax=Paenibacillus sp. sgz500992 TaxID=3242476 RepID=UPI0036D34053
MTTPVKEGLELRKTALTAGISLIIMAIAAYFSYGYVHGSLVIQGDASATLNNLRSSNMLFRAEIFGWLLILICDIVVAWAFYLILKPIDKKLSLLGAWFRLIYSAILGIAILSLLLVMLLSSGADYLSLFTTGQLQGYVMLFLEAFELIWSAGLIIFGGHLMIVGYVAFRSDTIPKVIGILLLIAAAGYIIIHFCNSFLPQYDEFITILEFVFNVPMIVGELGFGIWLMIKGGKFPKKA